MERGGDLENQLERVRSEKNALQDRLRDAELQILQLKSAEAVRRRSDEEIRQSLVDEIRRLRQTVAQTEGEKREMEERIAKREERNQFLRGIAEYYRKYIKSLCTELDEERQKKRRKTPRRNV